MKTYSTLMKEMNDPVGKALYDQVNDSKYSNQLHDAWGTGDKKKVEKVIKLLLTTISKQNLKLVTIYMGLA